MTLLTRRGLLGTLGAGTGGLLLAGCDKIVASPKVQDTIQLGEGLTMRTQRLITDRTALAPEFSAAEMSPVFRTNGTAVPGGAAYQNHAANRFADWRLKIDGLVRKPLDLSLAQIRTMPARTQITRHDCTEGWSAIGKWTGLPLKLALDAAGLLPSVRYIVFHCADTIAGRPFYESIDLVDAYHPQTVLAWGMNDRILSVGHGAPLRLRVERQLGYKHAKYVMRVEAVASLAGLYGGKGGLWEDLTGYQWYAGI